MPADLVFHEGHALALDRIGDDHRGPALAFFRGLEGGLERREVVGVGAENVPAEGLELFVVGGGIDDVGDLSIDLPSPLKASSPWAALGGERRWSLDARFGVTISFKGDRRVR